jgi:glycosyltransferase involved in cell wall biosynthesis
MSPGVSFSPQGSGSSRGDYSVSRLLLFNLVTDVKHPILGFTTQWIREIATRVKSIDVITMYAGEIAVPDNVRVHSVGRERGWSEPRRILEFYRHLFRITGERRIDGCFSHMIQIFSVLGAPVLRARGIPLVTWYAHPQLGPTLKLAHFLSDGMVTSLPGAYPYRKDKLTVIGQGIDTTLFAPDERAGADDSLILCVGRLSRVKNHPTLLRAFSRLPPHLWLEIVGATAGPADEAYAAGLRTLAAELGIANRVVFAPPVPPSELPAHYRRCAVHVNLTPAGFGDKVAWEAMSCGRPCLVANDDFRETLGAHADRLLCHGEEDLVKKMAALLAESAEWRTAVGLDLRENVIRLHSLPRLADRILTEITRLSPARTVQQTYVHHSH